MKKSKKKRHYSSERMTAINHPMRISLLDLIKEGISTAPQMAKILNENRIKLYHHLGFLEKAGLIESYYENDRNKHYRLQEQKKISKDKNFNINMDSDAIIVNPDVAEREEFDKKVRELISSHGIILEDNLDIIQIQVIIRPKSKTEFIQSNLKKYREISTLDE